MRSTSTEAAGGAAETSGTAIKNAAKPLMRQSLISSSRRPLRRLSREPGHHRRWGAVRFPRSPGAREAAAEDAVAPCRARRNVRRKPYLVLLRLRRPAGPALGVRRSGRRPLASSRSPFPEAQPDDPDRIQQHPVHRSRPGSPDRASARPVPARRADRSRLDPRRSRSTARRSRRTPSSTRGDRQRCRVSNSAGRSSSAATIVFAGRTAYRAPSSWMRPSSRSTAIASSTNCRSARPSC